MRCPRCLGHGVVPIMPGAHLSVKVTEAECTLCGGAGKILEKDKRREGEVRPRCYDASGKLLDNPDLKLGG